MTATAVPNQTIKARHRDMWTLGDYPAVATELIAPLGPTLVEATRLGPGDRVLDVAAGSGNVALPAAERGAEVVASDLTPALLESGRREAARRGLDVEWREADAEALPFDDASFDAVVSCVGVMFTPFHQAAADELVRVCRPGGRVGLINWTPQGFIGRMFATMKPFVAPPPAGASAPPLWGDPDHVAGLLGDRVTEVEVERRSIDITRLASAEEFLTFFKTHYGPTIAAYRGLAGDPDRVAELDTALLSLARDHLAEHGRFAWEYLLLTGTRA
jgi:SAM-dependent methyltransferase